MAEVTNEELLAKMSENFQIVLDDIHAKYVALAQRQNRLASRVDDIYNNVVDIHDLLEKRTRLSGTDLEDVQKQLKTVLELLKKQ